MSWDSSIPPVIPPSERFGIWRTIRRGVPLLLLILICLPLMMVTRAVECLFVGARRPYSSVFPRVVSRLALKLMGLRLVTQGTPMREHGAVVANHSSWLDIFVLNACQRIFFVSKAEVAAWPGIGLLARATGTVFITRKRSEASAHKTLFETRLTLGHKLLFFPEGTSTDGLRVLPFKTTLFAAFFTDELRPLTNIQPVSVRYVSPYADDQRFYGWWGDMDFASSLLQLLKAPKQGRVDVTFHTPISVMSATDRKSLAKQCEEAVRSAMPPTPDGFLDVS